MNQPLAYVHPRAVIAKNVVIEPFTTIDKNVEIGEGTWIGSNVTIMEGARIGKNCSIGPFARVRPEANFGDNVKIGNFVEIKKSLNPNYNLSDIYKLLKDNNKDNLIHLAKELHNADLADLIQKHYSKGYCHWSEYRCYDQLQ